MKFYLQLIRLYFQSLTQISPETAGRQALKLFQRTMKRPIRLREQAFYEQAKAIIVPHESEDIVAYETGNSYGPLVFLVHGWDGNAGQMAPIAQQLGKQGYRVISFDLPAHGKSKLKYTNLRKMSQALHSVIAQIDPTEPFSVVAHSFGSAVSIYSLTQDRYDIDKLVLLTSPDKFEPIFMEFAQTIGLNKKAYQIMVNGISKIVRQPAGQMHLSEMCRQIPVRQFTMMHDRHDKVLPFRNAALFAAANPECELIALENVGHYRMLWNEEVLQRLSGVFEQRVFS